MKRLIWLFHFLFFFFQCQSASSSPLSSSPSSNHSCSLNERTSLLQFKQMFTIDSYASFRQCDELGSSSHPKTVSWNETTDSDCCSWDGVTCNVSTGHVIGLDLSCSKLYGTIHPNTTLYQLPHLQQLNLAFNHFNFSPFPPSFSRFTSLSHLNLSSSFLSGSIPSEITHLFKLVSLDLSSSMGVMSKTGILRLEPHNFKTLLMNLTQLENLKLTLVNISSGLPDSLMNLSSLATLDLKKTGLSGKLPDSIGYLGFLNYLDLSVNELSGPLPESLGNLTWITVLRLSENNLNGQVPSTLSNLEQLSDFHIEYNNLNGTIPEFFSKFTKLEYLRLDRNNFKGPFPRWVANLTQLVCLDISSNPLTAGPIPNLSGLPNLQWFGLSNSNRNGTLPSWLFGIPSLQTLDLGYNQLTGQIHEFRHDSQLWNIDLRNNKLNGPIPQSISGLVNLRYLFLSSNNLSGIIELQIFSNLEVLDLSKSNTLVSIGSKANTTWPNLRFLGLSYCNITEFPEFLKSAEKLQSLDLSHNILRGQVPSTLSNLEQLTDFRVEHNNLNGTIPEFFSKFTKLEYLRLDRNNFNGPFPRWVANLTQLVCLDISSNPLNAGPIPNLSGLPNLQWFGLSNSNRNGTLPSWLFGIPSLQTLDLGYNQLTGQIHEFRHDSQLWIIDLKNNKLNGPIPQSISSLVNLRYLLLSSNNLSVVIELRIFSNLEVLDLSKSNTLVSIGSKANTTWPNLRVLGLSSCNITEFPEFLKSAEKLQSLDLSNNKIRGPLLVPSSSLIRFLISHNKLTGEFPSSICNMSFLEILVLSNNNLNGVIPHCLGNVINNLKVLDLRTNDFHGAIPTTFANRSMLRSLNLNGNRFQGPVPRSLANCKSMEVLDLGNNNLNGEFPHWLESLPELQVLVLKSNKFHGPIGTSRTETPFPKLRIIDLSHNNFTGLLPEPYFLNFKALMNVDKSKSSSLYMGDTVYRDTMELVLKGVVIELKYILTTFTTIDLSNNHFRGEIPNNVGKLQGLRLLNLSQNSLSGHLPSLLQNMTMLESLDLSSNQITGEIPGELKSLTFLAVLNLSKNHLVGPIPHGNQFDTFQNDSYIGNSGLCGLPLSKKCGDSEAQPQPPQPWDVDDDDDASGFTWRIVLMGYGCGLVIGVTMGFVMFLTGRPRWFTRIVIGGEPRRKVVRISQIGWRSQRS
ncbi:receptor-like protein 9DC3 [Rhododendron vialii]|uniref:receptor-like protein 9DC3 n=1 Tax=Rhododendron vialii TaxID=182163 RepID=UPI00265DCD79|nr:receptor-like protein 9DC3 [Rhododendron vialii]